MDTKKPQLRGFSANSLTGNVSAVIFVVTDATGHILPLSYIPVQCWQKECLNSSCGVESGVRTDRKTPTAYNPRQAGYDNPRRINSTWDRSPLIGISHS